MNPARHQAVLHTIRHLEAAEGYLELELPGRALEELEAIKESGPFEGSVTLLRGEALKGQKLYGDAITALHKAAQMIPAPHNRRAWKSLGECYRLDGREELANLVESFATAPQASPKVILPVINISITIQPPADLPQNDDSLENELGDEERFEPGFDIDNEFIDDDDDFIDDDDDDFDVERN